MTRIELELDDIQGNIIPGFNTNLQVFLGLSAADGALPDAARAWIAALARRVTTAEQVRAQRPAMLRMVGERAWMFVALSARLLRAADAGLRLRDQAIAIGMARRSLGDPPATRWRVGGPRTPLDVLVIVAANDLAAVNGEADALVGAATRVGFVCTYRELGTRLADAREHFGFRDGIAQPVIAGVKGPAGLPAGVVLFGYPRAPGGPPVVNREHDDLARNGSLVVFRRLRQDVAAFRAFTAERAAELRAVDPELDASQLAAMLVGRWPSGALYARGARQDPGRPRDQELDAFDFADDLEGRSCPLAAHIRQVNPRQGPADVAVVPRILRRGIPYGPEFTSGSAAVDRGLLFVCLQTSITRQFEFLSKRWMNDPHGPNQASGQDLLVGQCSRERCATLPLAGTATRVGDGGKRWVTMTGGAYLFAPGRRALASLG